MLLAGVALKFEPVIVSSLFWFRKTEASMVPSARLLSAEEGKLR